jgi:hypothetical protein
LAFFSTLLVDAFEDEEAVFYPFHHNYQELDQVKQPPKQLHSNGRLIFLYDYLFIVLTPIILQSLQI